MDGRLISGDTLFLAGCGLDRATSPQPSAGMFRSLRLLASLPDDTRVFPGHRYSADLDVTLGAVKAVNATLQPSTESEWLARFVVPAYEFAWTRPGDQRIVFSYRGQFVGSRGPVVQTPYPGPRGGVRKRT